MDKSIFLGLILLTIVSFATKMQSLSPIFINSENETAQDSIYSFNVTTIDGKEKTMSEYKGQVLLIVNTASKCGYTSQYEGLQKLQEEFSDKGFTVLAFPSNQFANQEPGTDQEIKVFCETKYQTTFPIFSKIDVNGTTPHPLYEYLKEKARNSNGTEHIEWNFTKFLVDRKGVVIKRYNSKTLPKAIAQDIAKLL